MATVIKPPEEARIVRTCDTCGTEHHYLETCVVCGADYCIMDEGIVPASYGFTRLCKGCSIRDDVREVCSAYAGRLQPIFQARDQALAALSA